MARVSGLLRLEARVAQLDAAYMTADASPLTAVRHVVAVMSRITGTGTRANQLELTCQSADEADHLLRSSRMLGWLADLAPEIVVGPLRRDSQYWIATGKPAFVPQRPATLEQSAFVDAASTVVRAPSTKPFGVGLFTSTGAFGTHGMWALYLDANRGTTLHSLPWQTWGVEPDPRAIVCEITSASEWVQLVLAHRQNHDGLLVPDWPSIARHYDAVHITLRAIATIQGLYFQTTHGTVAPSYWDVESTLWLRWCFDTVRLVKTDV